MMRHQMPMSIDRRGKAGSTMDSAAGHSGAAASGNEAHRAPRQQQEPTMRRGPPTPPSPPSRPGDPPQTRVGGDHEQEAEVANPKAKAYLPELISCVSCNVENKSDMSAISDAVAHPWQVLFLQEVAGS